MKIYELIIKERVYEKIDEERKKIGKIGKGLKEQGNKVEEEVEMEKIEIIEESDMVENESERGERMKKRIREIKENKMVGEVRGVGIIEGVEMVIEKEEKKGIEKKGEIGERENDELKERGVI